MNVDSEGGLRYTLFSNKRKKVTVYTGVYSNEKVLLTDSWER